VKSKNHTAYIGVGSNLGDKLANIRSSKEMLDKHIGIEVMDVSGLYRTEPFGDVEQDDFLNCVFKIETVLGPQELLEALMNVEKKLKRVRTVRWGPRTLDLDILFYDKIVLKTETLTIPHPGIQDRLFVLIPVNDLIPDYIHPVLKKSCSVLEKELRVRDASEVIKSGLTL